MATSGEQRNELETTEPGSPSAPRAQLAAAVVFAACVLLVVGLVAFRAARRRGERARLRRLVARLVESGSLGERIRLFGALEETVDGAPERLGPVALDAAREAYVDATTGNAQTYLAALRLRLGEEPEADLAARGCLGELIMAAHAGPTLDRSLDEPFLERLRVIDPAAVDAAFAACLEDPDPVARAVTLRVMSAIRRLRPEQAVAFLGAPDVLVRRAALESLGSFADLRLVEPLLHALADEDSGVRKSARKAADELLPRLWEFSKAKWDLTPDATGKILTERPMLVGELRSLSGACDKDKDSRRRADSLFSAVRVIHAKRVGALFEAAEAAWKDGDAERYFRFAERAIRHRPERSSEVGQMLYRLKRSGRSEKARTIATDALERGLYKDDAEMLEVLGGAAGTARVEAAVDAIVRSAALTDGDRAARWKIERAARLVRSALGDLAPGDDFLRLLKSGRAGGYLELAEAFEGEGFRRLALSSLEKASLVPAEREKAFTELARVYSESDDASGLKRTLDRATGAGVRVPRAEELRWQLPFPEMRAARPRYGPARVAWEFRFPPKASESARADHVRSGRFLIEAVTGHPGGPSVYALDIETGEVAWQYPDRERFGPLETSGLCKVFHMLQTTFATEAELTAEYTLARWTGDSTTSSGRQLHRVNARTGEPLDVSFCEVPCLPNRHVFRPTEAGPVVGAWRGFLTAVDLEERRRLWCIDLKPGHTIDSSDRCSPKAAYHGGVAFAASNSRLVKAIRLEDGKVLWRARLTGRASAAPAVAGDAVVLGSDDGSVVALDRKDGRARWKKELPLWPVSAVAGAEAGRTVYVQDVAGGLYALNGKSGRTVWQRRLGGITGECELAVRDETLYSTPLTASPWMRTGREVFLHALDARTGRSLWAFPLDRAAASRAPPVVEQGVIFVRSERRVMAIRTGDQAKGLGERVARALELVEELARSGKVKLAALAAVEASDRLDPASIDLMLVAARATANAGLEELAVDRIDRYTHAVVGGEPVNKRDRELFVDSLRGQLRAKDSHRACRAALSLTRLGVYDDGVEVLLRHGLAQHGNATYEEQSALAAALASTDRAHLLSSVDSDYHFFAGALECRRRGDRSFLELCKTKRLSGKLLYYVVAPLGGKRGAEIVLNNLTVMCSSPGPRAYEAAALAVRRNPEMKRLLVRKMSDANDRVSREAMLAGEVLGYVEREEQLLDLVRGAGSRSWTAARALAETGSTAVVPRLVEMGNSADPKVRHRVALALAGMERDEALDILAAAAEAEWNADPPTARLRWNILRTMLTLRRPELLSWVLRYGSLKAHWRDGDWAAFVCEHASAEDIRPHVRDFVRGLGKARRNYGGSIAVLHRFCGEGLLEEAKGLAEDQDEAVRLGAERLLDYLGVRKPGRKPKRVDRPRAKPVVKPIERPKPEKPGPEEDIF